MRSQTVGGDRYDDISASPAAAVFKNESSGSRKKKSPTPKLQRLHEEPSPSKRSNPAFIPCSIKALPSILQNASIDKAIEVNPNNSAASVPALMAWSGESTLPRMKIASVISKQWRKNSTLLVNFIDTPSPPIELQERILSHMNAWNQFCSIRFVLTQSRRAEVRITLDEDGYWSYLGTDILIVPLNEPTMCLQGFTMQTPESEFYRVVRHETGHTLSFPHEHMREEIVGRINEHEAIDYFAAPPNNWTEETTRHNVLTALPYSALKATLKPDEYSIMCYWLPGQIMNDGIDVSGGDDIDTLDRDFAAQLYPF